MLLYYIIPIGFKPFQQKMFQIGYSFQISIIVHFEKDHWWGFNTGNMFRVPHTVSSIRFLYSVSFLVEVCICNSYLEQNSSHLIMNRTHTICWGGRNPWFHFQKL